jgi:hypothetical protein
MLSKLGLSAFFGAAFVLAMQPALAGDQDFTLVNATGYTISEVYVSPSKAADWEEDVLGRDVLAEGESTEIRFSRSEDTCRWDLKVVYEDDNSSAEWAALDLCEISAVTIRYNRKTGETSALTQ